MHTFLSAAALAAALLVAPAADAQTTRSQAVAHTDLNLRDARDLARFDLRLTRTARDLCGAASAYDMAGRRKDRACVADAVARASNTRAAVIAGATTTLVAAR